MLLAAAPAIRAAERARITELEALAADMLSRFARTPEGYRARVGQVQIGKWEAILGRQP